MRSKKISHKEQISEKLFEGLKLTTDIVARTLGPGGLPILIQREGTTPSGDPLGPLITKDGVTVALACEDPDPEIDLAIKASVAICSKTNRLAGDGTTTAMILGNAILAETRAFLRARPDLNPQIVRESIEEAAGHVKAQLLSLAVPCKEPKAIAEVATISANGDAEIGRVIMEAFEAVGAEGVITVDEGHSQHTTLEIVDGFQINRGAEAQGRFFNNAENTKFEAEKVQIVLYDGTLRSYTEVLPALQLMVKSLSPGALLGPVVFVANEFSPEVIQFLLMQRAEHNLQFCAVKSPHMTSVRTDMLDDMAILLGATRLGNGGRSLMAITLDDIGTAGRVVSSKYATTFYDGAGSEEAILARVDQLKAKRKTAESPYDASIISDRIGALSNGVAKIGVGGLTELEIKERYHRIEDALNAARAAVEEGVIAGGGVPFLRIARILKGDPQATLGYLILAKALARPFQQILLNIGVDPDPVSLQLYNQDSPTLIYNARSKELVEAFTAGIIDPVKVSRIALENAVSIAALLSTCGGAITFFLPPVGQIQ